jgi:hypothetical protein
MQVNRKIEPNMGGTVMTLAWGLVYDSHKYLFPPFSSLYPTDVKKKN